MHTNRVAPCPLGHCFCFDVKKVSARSRRGELWHTEGLPRGVLRALAVLCDSVGERIFQMGFLECRR